VSYRASHHGPRELEKLCAFGWVRRFAPIKCVVAGHQSEQRASEALRIFCARVAECVRHRLAITELDLRIELIDRSFTNAFRPVFDERQRSLPLLGGAYQVSLEQPVDSLHRIRFGSPDAVEYPQHAVEQPLHHALHQLALVFEVVVEDRERDFRFLRDQAQRSCRKSALANDAQRRRLDLLATDLMDRSFEFRIGVSRQRGSPTRTHVRVFRTLDLNNKLTVHGQANNLFFRQRRARPLRRR